MSRYIDADELRSFIKDQYFKCDMPEEWGNGVMWATSEINHYCNKVAPSIDIVRCKECKHCKMKKGTFRGEPIFFYRCTEHSRDVESDDYCSWGEREGER